ncbi:Npr-3 [Meloidogyne graminicola]|uniref:Npr-3 n=1 Tax=Meloidogyne graminicola TaxID=189291 RepID=A0A8S9ZMH9_9BILA|nr:Npr-3 [Meloidogyne graminicola]
MELERHLLASCTLSIIIFGCFGNILSALIFLQRTSSINILLTALSLIDFGLLLFAIPVFVLPNLQNGEGEQFYSEQFQAIIVKFLYPVNLIFQTCSIYTIVLITAERWLAICRPLHVRLLCTSRTAKRSLLCILCFSIAYNIIRFWEYRLIKSFDGSLSFQRNLRNPNEHPWYMIGYYSLLFLLSHFLLPFGTIISLNGMLAHRILNLRLIREQLTNKQLREHNTTSMLLLVTLSFALCNALPFLLNLAECIQGDLFTNERTASLAFILNDLANFLVVLNSSTTWIYYAIFSAKYREGVAYLFGLRTLDRRRSGLAPSIMEERSNSACSNFNSANGGIQYFESK